MRVHPDLASRVREGGHYTRIVREEPPDADGWTCFVIDFEVEFNAVEYVLGFGPHIDVIEPAVLRDQVIALAKGIVDFYARR